MDPLTTTDWRALAPGRELDAIVAERVFGVERERVTQDPWDDGLAPLPEHSTDVAAAIAVAEALRGRGYIVQLRTDRMMGWECFIWRDPEDNPVSYSFGDLSEAIVRAALAALDSETRGEG